MWRNETIRQIFFHLKPAMKVFQNYLSASIIFHQTFGLRKGNRYARGLEGIKKDEKWEFQGQFFLELHRASNCLSGSRVYFLPPVHTRSIFQIKVHRTQSKRGPEIGTLSCNRIVCPLAPPRRHRNKVRFIVLTPNLSIFASSMKKKKKSKVYRNRQTFEIARI